MTKVEQARPFAVFDIDGTLIRWQLYHAIADELIKRHGEPTTYQAIKLARLDWKRRTAHEGFKAYEAKLVEGYEAVLKTLTVDQFQAVATEVFDEYKDQVYRYTRELIKDLKAKGYLLFAISGSHIEVVEMMANYYGFDDCVGTIYKNNGKTYTGEAILHQQGKHIILDEMVQKHGATYKGSVAVGDSEGDITMLEAVEQAIAMNPSQKLFDHATAKGWKIVVERKNMIYELEQRDGTYILA